MVLNKNNFFLTLVILEFFLIQILTGVYRLAFSVLLVGTSIIFCLLKKYNFCIIIFLIMLFQMAFREISVGVINQFFTFFDELIEVCILLFILNIFKKRTFVSRDEKRILFFYCCYIIITFLSSVFFIGYASPSTIIMDFFVCSKFIVFFIGGVELSRKNIISDKSLCYILNSPCKIIAVFLFLLSIHDLLLPPFWDKYDFRYFTYSLRLCFQHPTYLAAVCIACMVILMNNMSYGAKNIFYIFLLSVVTCFTFRSKALVSIFAFWAVYFSCIKYKLPFKILILIGIGFISFYLGLDQLEKYFIARSVVPIRLKMLQDGISIAIQHFPFGAGFGTFGTTVAFSSGSKFYYDLDYMSGYYKDQPVGDAFWPGILAESGVFGTVFFAFTILWMVIYSLKILKVNKYSGWCMLSILIYSIIASTAETAFFNPATAFMFLFYGVSSIEKLSLDKER